MQVYEYDQALAEQLTDEAGQELQGVVDGLSETAI